MRLTHIKLSGFKSFVDPTVIPIPGRLVGVVGPNGCGKSNIIDAVRWVLGEASAKQLRGASMQDVIFNGSTTRKPVSRASVELLFDNKEGRLVGLWAPYAEISIKRVLTRQGESDYFINNQSVRRRDITDLFLGTGVGVRGYAVIEQGMISRLIEAKPDELRGYLEEAAGISRYKERRRETARHLVDTRDNLKRVDDLRHELLKQVEKLTDQAEVATRYYHLREELRRSQSLLILVRYKEAQHSEALARVELARIETEETALAFTLSVLDSELLHAREAHLAMSDAVHEAQQRVYEVNARLVRLEEQRRYGEQDRQRIRREQVALQAEYQMVSETYQQVVSEKGEWGVCIEHDQQCLAQIEQEMEWGVKELARVQTLLQTIDDVLVPLTSTRENLARRRDLAQQRIEHLSYTLQRLSQRENVLRDEVATRAVSIAQPLTQWQESIAQWEAELALVNEHISLDEAMLSRLMAEQHALNAEQSRLCTEEARIEAEIAARVAFLNSVDHGEQLGEWLASQCLDKAPTLWQGIDVEEKWQVALEAILQSRMTARVAVPLPDRFPPAIFTVLDAEDNRPIISDPEKLCCDASGYEIVRTHLPSLREKIVASSPFSVALDEWLEGVFTAESLDIALAQRESLPFGAEWVTPEGHRVCKTNITYFAPGNNGGILTQRAQLDAVNVRLDALRPLLIQVQQRCETIGGAVHRVSDRLKGRHEKITLLTSRRNQAMLELARQEESMRQARERLAAVESELIVVEEEQQETRAVFEEVQLIIEESTLQLDALTERHQQQLAERLFAENRVMEQRQCVRESERQAHQLQLKLATIQQKCEALTQREDALLDHRQSLSERLSVLNHDALLLDDVLNDEEIDNALVQRDVSDQQLCARRDDLQKLTERMRGLTVRQSETQAMLLPLRDKHSQCLLRHQEALLAVEHFAEELTDKQVNETELCLESMGTMKVSRLTATITRLTGMIEDLGPVNLVALDELQQAKQRDEYLAHQAEDLNSALVMLEKAIDKIDGECRNTLKATYNEVNAWMSEFFPTLFGGGSAQLVLTGEDWLEAGFQITAQPPGKKNSSIHLLSGGEKALTAISLVFSLFSLNPAPFCLLDEVDAPLDEANTRRFCDLVKKMAKSTQFLYVSHNRVTMEMAEQLVGVTMQERGVSRIVAVDIVEALKFHEE